MSTRRYLNLRIPLPDGLGRQQAPQPASVEFAQPNPPPALDLLDQQPGDQVSGKHEENVDAHVASREPRHTGVSGNDEQDRDRPESFDIGTETEAKPGWRRCIRRTRVALFNHG